MRLKKVSTLLSIFCISLLILFSSLNIFSYAQTGYSVINSQTLFEKSTLDDLELNYNTLPTVSISGNKAYKMSDSLRNNIQIRQVDFNYSPIGETLDSVITVKYNNCGTLNR